MRQESSSRFTLGAIVVGFWASTVMVPSPLQAQQPTSLWLHLRPKTASLSQTTPAKLGITERSLWRRSKVLPADRVIDALDLPIDETVLEHIR